MRRATAAAGSERTRLVKAEAIPHDWWTRVCTLSMSTACASPFPMATVPNPAERFAGQRL
eukprot:3622711-Pyramimonas_sp.AAC.2